MVSSGILILSPKKSDNTDQKHDHAQRYEHYCSQCQTRNDTLSLVLEIRPENPIASLFEANKVKLSERPS